jgi:hypothetical protein
MITQELTMYMREALRRKMTFDTIKSELLRVGWAQEDIVRCYDTIFNELQGVTAPQSSPVVQPVTAQPAVAASPVVASVVEPVLVKEIAPEIVPTSSPLSFYSQNNTPVIKHKTPFLKVFLIVSILVVLGLGGVAYAGLFLNDTMVQTALVKGISSSSAVESDVSLSFSPKQEDKDATTSSLSIQGQHNQNSDQFSYKASFSSRTKETNVNIEIRSVDDVLYLFTQDLPEFLMTELLAYENQWFRIPLTKEGVEDVSTQDLQIPSFATDSLQTFSDGISDDMKKKIRETPFLKMAKKGKIVFVDMMPYYKVEFSPNYDAISEILATQETDLLSVEDVRSQVEKIKQGTEGVVSMYMWIGVLDGRAHKVEIMSIEGQEDSLSLKALFQFSKKVSSIEAPSVSYTVPEFVEKARSGLIPNVMIGDVSYADYLEAKRVKQEEERIQNERVAYLTNIVENGTAASFFVDNKKSFSGICQTFSVDFTCRDARTGFVAYAEIKELGNPMLRYMCIDAYTKDAYTILDGAPKKMRCQ